MEVISHDVVELILEKLSVKSLLRFRLVSKQWKSTIDSNSFKKRQLIYRQQKPNPEVLFMIFSGDDDVTKKIASVYSVKLPLKMRYICSNSCDGLICLYNNDKSIMVINPNTRWYRYLPLPNMFSSRGSPWVGFGKDKFNGRYKLVWLFEALFYDKRETICQVFDFNVDNTWRYITPSTYPIIDSQHPVCVDGSLYWLTRTLEIKVLSFDLHTETFEVLVKPPFGHGYFNSNAFMCNLNNSLCVTEKILSNQVIWLLNSDKKTWNQIYSIDLSTVCCKYCIRTHPIMPVAILEEKNKLLVYHRDLCRGLKLYDYKTKSTDLVTKDYRRSVCCVQSLISIL